MSKKYNKINPDISVLIPVYGGIRNSLLEALESIVKAIEKPSYEIVIVDDKSPNLSEDDKIFYSGLKQRFPIKTLYYHKENKGFGAAVNSAASFARGKYFLIWSTDVRLNPGAVDILYEQLVNNDDIAITFPKLLFPINSPNGPAGAVQHCGIVFDLEKNPRHNFIGWHPQHPFVNRVRDYNACTGATFLIKSDVWKLIKGFDPIFGRGTSEDIDLSIRVRTKGFKIRFLPQAEGTHYVGESSIRENAPFPVQKNLMYLKQKYFEIIPYDSWLYSGL